MQHVHCGFKQQLLLLLLLWLWLWCRLRFPFQDHRLLFLLLLLVYRKKEVVHHDLHLGVVDTVFCLLLFLQLKPHKLRKNREVGSTPSHLHEAVKAGWVAESREVRG